jgi:hypothetical protein
MTNRIVLFDPTQLMWTDNTGVLYPEAYAAMSPAERAQIFRSTPSYGYDAPRPPLVLQQPVFQQYQSPQPRYTNCEGQHHGPIRGPAVCRAGTDCRHVPGLTWPQGFA